MKRWQSILLGIVVSVLTLAYALRGVDFNQLKDVLVGGNYLWLIPSFLIAAFGLGLRAFRWRVLLHNRITINHSFNILNASYLLNSFLPARLGEVVRSFMVTRLDPPISMFTSLSTVVVERLLDVIAVVVLIILSVAIAPITPDIERAGRVTGILAVVGIAALILFAARPAIAHGMLGLVERVLPFLKRLKLSTLLDRVLEGIAPLGSPRSAVELFGWTAAGWLFSVLQVAATMLIFYPQAQPNAVFLVLALAALAVAVPAVPGNVGPFEAAIVLGLTVAGMASATNPQDQARAVAYGVVLHIISVGTYAFLGFIGLAQEHISLGEVIRSARQMASRSKKADSDSAPNSAAANPDGN